VPYRVARLLPEAVILFSKRYGVPDPNSPEFRADLIRQFNGLDVLLNLLDEPFVLMQQIQHVIGQHAHIDEMKANLIRVSLNIYDR